MSLIDTDIAGQSERNTAGSAGAPPLLSWQESFARDGFAGPLEVLSPDERLALLSHLQRRDLPAPFDWPKGRAITDRTIYEFASSPRILKLLRPVLGEDILLWGAERIVRQPGKAHGWHCDLECSVPGGRFAALWIGLQNTSRESGLVFVAGSHLLGKPIQQVVAERDNAPLTDERVAGLAAATVGDGRIVRPDVADGQALLFDGRVWHSGRNDSETGPRMALLLQYAAADAVLRMPVSNDYRWPFKLSAPGRLPVVLVSGSDRAGINRLVAPPAPLRAKDTPMIATRVKIVDLPLAEDPIKRWRAYPQFRGPTRTLESMSCHISVLSPGHMPHAPHVHPEEELLVVLDGEVEIALATHPEDRNTRKLRLRPGMFSYYPHTQHHTIYNPGAAPVTYLMFKWLAGEAGSADPLQASVFGYHAPPDTTQGLPPFHLQRIFQQATHRLGKLQAHLTTLQPGAGYEPHVDAYDVAIVLLAGEIETLGERLRPLGLIYYAAGEPHGMRNMGTTPATYLVFEFHSPAAVAEKDRAMRQARDRRAAGKAARKKRRRPLHKVYKYLKRLVRPRR